MTSNAKSASPRDNEGNSHLDGSTRASRQTGGSGVKEVLSINSGNESGGKNSDDIASSSSSSGIDLTREFLYVQFEKREKDGDVFYVADTEDSNARHQFFDSF